MILVTRANEVWNLSNMFLTLQKFALKEDKLELKCRDLNSMTKRDLGFDDEDIYGKLEIIPGFHFYITAINSKHQSSFLFSFKFELMLLLAILNVLKSFWWYFLMFANSWIYWKVELLQLLTWNTTINFIDMLKVFIWLSTGKLLYYISTQLFSTICKHHYKIISQGNIHHVWNVVSIVSKQDWGGYMWE